MPKDSLRRHEDLCPECWEELEQLHGTFPVWKEGLSGDEILRHQAKLFRGTARLHHQAYCRKCWRGFEGCESLIEAAERGSGADGDALRGDNACMLLQRNIP